MKVAFTPKIAFQYIQRAKNNFKKNKATPKEWVKVLESLPVFLCVRPELAQRALAWSYIVPIHSGLFDIKPSSPHVKIHGQKLFLVHEYSSELMARAKNETAFNLVAHELAHSLDYVLRDEMQVTSKSHDAFFQVLFEFMGGRNKYYFPEKKGASLRAKRSLESFGGAGKVVIDF